MFGEDADGSTIKIFNFEVAYTKNTESYEKIEFKTSDFTKGSPDTKFKSRENEMKAKNFGNEVFKCDPCTKPTTRKEKIQSYSNHSSSNFGAIHVAFFVFFLSKPVFPKWQFLLRSNFCSGNFCSSQTKTAVFKHNCSIPKHAPNPNRDGCRIFGKRFDTSTPSQSEETKTADSCLHKTSNELNMDFNLIEEAKIYSADVFANSRPRLNDVSRNELVTLEKFVDKIHSQPLANNLFDASSGKHGFGQKRLD